MSIETRLNKICVDCKQEFTIDSGDLVLYEKVGLKIPEKCFDCRMKQFFIFSIFGKFRKGVSDLSGESLITVLPAKLRFPLYKSHEWWSDSWDPLEFGQNYDPKRPFFYQLKELQEKVPRPHQTGQNNTNCDWCDDVWDCKDCYLSRSMSKCENCSYIYRVLEGKDSYEIVYSFKLQSSFDCLECYDSFNLYFSRNSRDCIDSYFLYDCRNCQNCFMCWNLRNKKYCIKNKQYTKEEYEVALKNMKLDSYKNLEIAKKEFENFLRNEAVHRENQNLRCTNSVGNYMTDCDKCVNVFAWEYSQNCRNCLRGLRTKDCIDLGFSWNLELSGNNGVVDGGYEIKHSACSIGKYSEYVDNCKDVEYCFGCVGLKKKKYCILNKQYEKEEYEELKKRIIADMEKSGEYGKFFPYSFGIGHFNLSNGMIYFPETTKEEVLGKGGYWQEENLSQTDGISSLELPDSIFDTNPEITTKALICPETRFRYNIAPAEYEFHKRKGFALPRKHFDKRILDKMKKVAILKSYPYKCVYCQNDIMAYYPPEWGYQKIACENCYKQNIA